MIIKIKPIEYTPYGQDFNISAKHLASLDNSEVIALRDSTKAKLSEGCTTFYDTANELIFILKSAELYLEKGSSVKDGRIKIDKNTGKFIARPFNIKTQRIANRIINKIIESMPEVDDGKGREEFEIELKSSDAIYLAKKVMIYMQTMYEIQPYVPIVYDYFADIYTKALNNK